MDTHTNAGSLATPEARETVDTDDEAVPHSAVLEFREYLISKVVFGISSVGDHLYEFL